jgi:hypothetical protein
MASPWVLCSGMGGRKPWRVALASGLLRASRQPCTNIVHHTPSGTCPFEILCRWVLIPGPGDRASRKSRSLRDDSRAWPFRSRVSKEWVPGLQRVGNLLDAGSGWSASLGRGVRAEEPGTGAMVVSRVDDMQIGDGVPSTRMARGRHPLQSFRKSRASEMRVVSHWRLGLPTRRWELPLMSCLRPHALSYHTRSVVLPYLRSTRRTKKGHRSRVKKRGFG